MPRTDLVSSPCSMSSESKFNILLIFSFLTLQKCYFKASSCLHIFNILDSAMFSYCSQQPFVDGTVFCFVGFFSLHSIPVGFMYSIFYNYLNLQNQSPDRGHVKNGSIEHFSSWKYERDTFLLFLVTQEPQLQKHWTVSCETHQRLFGHLLTH